MADLRDGVSDPLHKFNKTYVEDQYQTIRTWLEIVKEKLGFPAGCIQDEWAGREDDKAALVVGQVSTSPSPDCRRARAFILNMNLIFLQRIGIKNGSISKDTEPEVCAV